MRRILRLLLGAGALLLLGCRGPVEGLVGEYEAEGRPGTRLALRADGGGTLCLGEGGQGMKEAPFHWEVKEGRKVVLHLRQGDAIVLNLASPGLDGDLPGLGRAAFRKK